MFLNVEQMGRGGGREQMSVTGNIQVNDDHDNTYTLM